MSAMGDKKINQKSAKAIAKAKRRVVKHEQYGTADWAAADPQLLQICIASITLQGGAIRLGYTSDGGAYSIGIYGDGDPYTDYVRPAEGIDDYLAELARAWSE